MKNWIVIVGIISLALISCTDNSETIAQLKGHWKAVTMVTSDTLIKNDLKDINFTFHNDRVYSYQGGPSYQEAGTYRIQGSVFYSTDTLATNRKEKAVKIIHLTSDSLYLDMNDSGIKKEMRLVKVK